MITKAKRSLAAGDPIKVVNARRQAAAVLYGNEIVKKLFDEIAPKYRHPQRRLHAHLQVGDAQG